MISTYRPQLNFDNWKYSEEHKGWTIPANYHEEKGNEPFRWWLFDNLFFTEDINIPDINSGIWEAKYTASCEQGKRTTRDLDKLNNLWVQNIFNQLRYRSLDYWSEELGYRVEDDPTVHGGGLHVTSPSGQLSVHLDYDRHPKLPTKRRALNIIAFLHDKWKSEWGGELVLCDPLGNIVKKIEPLPGRVVAFEVNDISYHGVLPITGPKERVSLAIYFLNDAGPNNTRQRALFMPNRTFVDPNRDSSK